jgi:hypothetical protein
MKTPNKLITTISLSLLLSFGLPPILASAQNNTTVLPAIGTSAILGKVNGVAVEAKVQSPSNEATPLQIVCVFEYTDGDQFNTPNALPAAVNGMVHVDQQLKGLVTELRKSGKFEGHALETMLITPPAGSIAAKRLLIIGLGDRNKFSPDLMISVGRTGMREALRLGVTSYAHASDLKDGGLDSPTAIIAINVLKGAFEAYRTELELKSRKLTNFLPLSKITLLAGPAFYTVSGEALKTAITQLNQ